MGNHRESEDVSTPRLAQTMAKTMRTTWRAKQTMHGKKNGTQRAKAVNGQSNTHQSWNHGDSQKPLT